MALTPGQKACVETLDAPVAVSAGAGSGKTYTLTRRIVHAIETGAASSIDDVLAITFTTKAAGEIKARVKSALAAAGFADDARAVDGAWISTIHGMCSRILREHAVELGIDPSFSVIEGADADRLRDAAIDEALASANDMISPAGLDALFSEYPARQTSPFGGSSIESMLKAIVDVASANPRGFDAVTVDPEPRSGAVLLAQMTDCARTLFDLASAEKASKSRDAFVEGTACALEAADAALNCGVSDREAAALIAAFPYPAKNFGLATGGYKAFVEEACLVYDECMAEAKLAVAYPLLDDLLSLARSVFESYMRRKREAAVLDNNDLLIMAARALDDYPDIARSYVGRFSVIMVDEFQDTDQLQIDMIKRIAGEGWDRLCTVGDAQQSIYRFRGADVAVFRRHVQEVGSRNPKGLITLPDNFRSHADVLAFVDRVFEQPCAFGSSFMSLTASRDESRVAVPFLSDGPRIGVVDVAYAFRGVGADNACRFEADVIARRFCDLRDMGHGAGDMVVLLGSMTRADVYAAALRKHGFACVVQKGSVFNRAPEVRVVVRLVQVIANPAYTTALFEVLSSEMFDLSADDFIELSTDYDDERGMDRRQNLADGAARLARQAHDAPHTVPARLRAALDLLDRVRSQVGRRAVSRIAADCVRDSGWLTRLEERGAEGQAVAANVLKALRLVESIEEEGGIGPLTLARRFEHAVDLAREAPGALSTEEGDFVRIMTVHASKGLEFPIVAVAEMAEKTEQAEKLVCRPCGGSVYASLDAGYSMDACREGSTFKKANALAFPDYDEADLERAFSQAETAVWARAAARAIDAEGDAQERKRLMYVAITRAKEAVIVSMRGRVSSNAPSGISTAKPSVYGDIQSALFGAGEPIPAGVTMVDFGGTRPARVERIDLSEELLAQFDSACAQAQGHECGTDPSGEIEQAGGEVRVFLPAPENDFDEEPAAPLRERVFSYSSISSGHADAGPVADGEAEADARIGGAETLAGAGSGTCDGRARAPEEVCDGASATSCEDGVAHFTEPLFDDESWDAIRSHIADDDKATDLGTAFHRLAQLAVIARTDDGALVRPAVDRVEALCRSCHVTPLQRTRLDAALDRWFASSLAQRVARWRDVQAEVPFFVALDIDGAPAYLEGEIDLLATGVPACEGAPSSARAALVVDYKTGGSRDESPERLAEKHRLQATCYAYAVLLQGYDRVEAVFVRVEQEERVNVTALNGACSGGAADGSGGAADGFFTAVCAYEKGPDETSEPQYVRYAFSAADMPSIRQAIEAAYRESM